MVLFLLVSKLFMSVMRRSEVLWRVSHSTTICGGQIICRQDGIFVWLSFTEEMHEFCLLWTNTVIPIGITTFFFFFSACTQVNTETGTREKLCHDVGDALQNIFGSFFFFCLEVLARVSRESKSLWMRRRWSSACHARALIWDLSDVTAAHAVFEASTKKIRKKWSFGYVFINCSANDMVEMKWFGFWSEDGGFYIFYYLFSTSAAVYNVGHVWGDQCFGFFLKTETRQKHLLNYNCSAKTSFPICLNLFRKQSGINQRIHTRFCIFPRQISPWCW